MLPRPTALRDQLVRLLDDVGALRWVSACGFRDADRQRVADNLAAVAALPRWRLLDLRGRDLEAVAAALEQERGAAELLVLIDAAEPVARPLQALVKAFVDRRDALEWAPGRRAVRPPQQSLCVLIAGAAELAQAPRVLHEIPAWIFVGPGA